MKKERNKMQWIFSLRYYLLFTSIINQLLSSKFYKLDDFLTNKKLLENYNTACLLLVKNILDGFVDEPEVCIYESGKYRWER